MGTYNQDEIAPGKGSSSNGQMQLAFVDYSDPQARNSPATRRLIRRHAMKEIGKSRRKPKPIKTVELNVDGLRYAQQGYMSWWLGVRWQALPPPMALPVDKIDHRGQQLLACVFYGSEGGYQMHLRDAWFTVGLKDAAPFLQILANSALWANWSRLGGRQPVENYDSIRYQSQAVAAIQKEIQINQPATLEGALGAVTGLMAYQDISGNRQAWIVHHKGAQDLVRLRGGLEMIEGQEELRVTLSWCELRGSFIFDVQPVYPLPRQWLRHGIMPQISTKANKHITRVMTQWKQEFPDSIEWPERFKEIAGFSFATYGIMDNSHHQVDLSEGAWTNPVIHRFSSWRPKECLERRQAVIEEAVRLGTALYLTHVWRFFGVAPMLPDFLASKLKALLLENEFDWTSLQHFKLWALYMAAIRLQGAPEEAWFYQELFKCMEDNGLKAWDDMIQCIKSILWFGQLFDDKDGELRTYVQKSLDSRCVLRDQPAIKEE